MTRVSDAGWAVLFVAAGVLCAIGRASAASVRQTPQVPRMPAAPATAAALSSAAFQAAYSLDYRDAIDLARRAVAADPNDARAHRTLASMLWLELLFERGAVTVDLYLRGVSKSETGLPPVPPALDAEFQRELQAAVDLAEARLKLDPANVDALDEAGAAAGLQASYLASVRGSVTSAFGPARRAFDDESAVLERDPSRPGALCIVGLYRYVISTFGLPTRLFAYLVGFGGDKAKGLAMLEQASRAGSVEAGVSLLLVYARESRHVDALQLARRLVATYPRNRLFSLEAGAAAVRAGHGDEADSILSEGLASLATDTRPTFPGELAQWTYERGIARTERKRFTEARADLTAALSEHPAGWIEGRTHLQLGRVDDLESRRAQAIDEYRQARTICDAQHDDPCSNDASALLKRPFGRK